MSSQVQVFTPKSDVAEIFKNITTGLQVFEKRKAELIQLAEEASGIKATSYDDKAPLKLATEHRKKLKNARVEIEKEGKSMRDPLTGVNREISAKEKELVDIIAPTEKELKSVEDWYDAEKKRIDQEAQDKENERIQNRVSRLAEFGYEIDIEMIKGLSDEGFEKIAVRAKKEYEKEQADKLEQERIKEEERKELEELRRQKLESDRIIKEQQDKIESDRLEKEKRDKEEEKERAEALRTRIQQRVYRLNNTQFDGHAVVWKYDQSVILSGLEAIVHMPGREFNALVIAHNTENERVLHEKYLVEEERKNRLAEEEEKKRVFELEEARIAGVANVRLGLLSKLGVTYPDGSLGRLSEEEWDKMYAHRKGEYEDGQRKLMQQREEEQRSIEAERLAQSSDKEKFALIVAQIEGLNYPEMKSAKHKKLLTEVKELQAKVIAHIKAKA